MLLGPSWTGGQISGRRRLHENQKHHVWPRKQTYLRRRGEDQDRSKFTQQILSGTASESRIFVFGPNSSEENDARVVQTTLTTIFSIEALDAHRSLSTRASLGADTSSNLNHAESIAQYWLKDCLKTHEISRYNTSRAEICHCGLLKLKATRLFSQQSC
jgi:hypothetical protein